jgi:dipeptidyl aminopeptidase/acylaminoacyl peptidase
MSNSLPLHTLAPVWIVSALLCAPAAPAGGGASAPQRTGEQLVHRYLRVELSPDGSRVASVEGDSPAGGFSPRIRDLVIRGVRDGAAVTVALPCGRVPECWPDAPAWAPDGKELSFALRTPGSHARSLYRVGADGERLTKLLEFSGTIVQLRYGPEGGLAMLATADALKEVGATEAGTPVAGDLDAPPPEQRIALFENGGLRWASPPDLYVYEYDWLPEGKGFVATAAPGNGDDSWWEAKLYLFSAQAPPRVLYAPGEARQQLAEPKVSRDGRTVAFIAGIMSDFGSTGGDVYTLPVEGGVPIDLTPMMRGSAAALAWGCDGKLTARVLAADKTEIVDIVPGRLPQITRVLWSGPESLAFHELAACPSGSSAVVHESFTDPPEIEVGRIGRWRNLTSVNAGMHLAARIESLSWRSDDFEVQGWLMLPEHSAGQLPMITVVHGGPAAATMPSYGGPGLISELLARGYAVFRPNPRGSYGQGERFTMANIRDFGQGDLRDILAGIDAAAKGAPIDLTRLGITGGSYGGFMTMWAVTQTDRFKAAVAAAGVSDWLSYYGENGIDAWMLPYFGASAYEDPAIYARSSPINFIRHVHTPTFAYVGERDIECPAPQTQEFWHALKTLGVPTSIMIYPDEGHGLRDAGHIADALNRTLAWFDRYLKPNVP